MDSPETWRWVWLAVMVLATVGELFTPGAFILLPFAIGAAVATVLAFLDVGTGVQWVAFLGVSTVAFAAIRPLARRLDLKNPNQAVGATRMDGATGVVLEAIPGGGDGLGLVRVEREEWRAGSFDGRAVDQGTSVRVLSVQGTRLVVWPSHLDLPSGGALPDRDSSG